jgi:hypothetical protein
VKILGIDPGLSHTGLCLMNGVDITTTEIRLADGVEGWQRMGDLIVAWVDPEIHRIDVIGLEDFVFMAPKASHGIVKHAAQIGKLIGYLVAQLEARGADLVLVPASQAQRNQPKGKAAKAAGVPGRNDHERAAYNVANWVKGTMRLEGAAR